MATLRYPCTVNCGPIICKIVLVRCGNATPAGTIYEIALVVMSSYLAYLVAETVQLSGIVALFFTGICHAHYRWASTQHACGM